MNIEKIYEKYNGLCAYCGQRITINDMKVDQMMPESMEFDNLMPCCNTCKDYKGNDDIEEFREKLKTIHWDYIKLSIAMNYGIIRIFPFNGKFLFERY
jgi:5-methylcytosine-specific restriction endonuclease McrA